MQGSSGTFGLIVALCCGACQGGGASRSSRGLGQASQSDVPGVATAAEPALDQAPVGRVGVPISTAHYVLRVSAADDCSPAGPDPADARRLGVQLELEPTGELQVPANPYYARLVDGLGNVYEATLGGCGAALAPTLPARGQTARGRIVFELPRGARDLTLTYAPELVGGADAELSVALGR